MKKYIHITKENRLGLAKMFDVTDRMVWAAITFEKETDLAKRIRKAAIERGGIVMNELPALETFHDSDNYMREYLPNGAMLEFNKGDGTGDVIFKGKSVKHYPQVMISEIGSIQSWASSLR
ncbi:MAG: hypothetical protein V8Q76_13190 [Bacteroides intestinalis]